MTTELKAHKKEPDQLEPLRRYGLDVHSENVMGADIEKNHHRARQGGGHGSLSADTKYLMCTIFHTISVVGSFYIPILLVTTRSRLRPSKEVISIARTTDVTTPATRYTIRPSLRCS